MTPEPIPLVVQKMIEAPREKIFDAFSSIDALLQWFTPSADISLDVLAFDFTVGGGFQLCYVMPDGRRSVVGGIYEIIEPPERIACSWIWEAPDPLAGHSMRVLFEFIENGTGTEVVITHHGIPSNQACSIHEDGWEGALDSLERHIAPANQERTN